MPGFMSVIPQFRMARAAIGIGIQLAATFAASFDAATATYNHTSGGYNAWNPATLGVIASSTPGVTYGLSGSQATGFDVLSDGTLRVASMDRVLDQGIRQQLLATRVFMLTASKGGSVASCAVTVTLTVPAAMTAAGQPFPGVSVATGRTSTNALSVAGPGNLPSGGTLNTGVYPAQLSFADNTTVTDWDLRGYRIINLSGNSIVINQCLMSPPTDIGTPLGLAAALIESRKNDRPAKRDELHDRYARPHRSSPMGGGGKRRFHCVQQQRDDGMPGGWH